MTYKDIAYKVLKNKKKSLHSKKITQIAIKQGWLKPKGLTPESTMNAQLVRDVNSKQSKSYFIKTAPSTFGLNSKYKKSKAVPISKEKHRIKKSTKGSIITDKLEKVGKELVHKKEIKEILRKHIGKVSGVYVLYNKEKIYYVGKATTDNLIKRVSQHLKDKHSKKWDKFSLYPTENKQYAEDIEAIIISIGKPIGNTNTPFLGPKEKKTNSLIKNECKKLQAKEMEKMFGSKDKKNLYKINQKQPNKAVSLNNPFKTKKVLKKIYKGKAYKALWLTSGQIEYKNKRYSSPTSVAKVVSGRKVINGKEFWRVQNNEGDWVQIKNCIKL